MKTATISLTKTERELLEKAVRRGTGRLYGQEWYSTSSLHLRSYGSRTTSAIASLVRKGLAEDLKITHSQGENQNGGTDHSSEYAARITEAGRLVIQ